VDELQKSIGKNENELASRLEELRSQLQEEEQLRFALEQELNELRKQPPKVTPRKPVDTPRSPSPQAVPRIAQPPPPQPSQPLDLIYLPEYCPLTLKAVQTNPRHLDNFRKYAEKMLEENLDEVGIDKVQHLFER
jgi:hypothetical protein